MWKLSGVGHFGNTMVPWEPTLPVAAGIGRSVKWARRSIGAPIPPWNFAVDTAALRYPLQPFGQRQ